MERDYLLRFFRRARTQRRLHLTSFDPAKHATDRLPEIVNTAIDVGTDGFLLGGSTDVDRPLVEAQADVIKATLIRRFPGEGRPPLLLFPSSAATAAAVAADGVLFLSLLNSNDPRYLIREQAKAAPYLPAMGLTPVGCGMISVEPGGTAGRVGHADLVRRDDWPTAVGYASAAQAFGFPLVYLNAGSGSPLPVPIEMVSAVAMVLTVPLVVGGGLTDPVKVRNAIAAGADVVITGTAIEGVADIAAKLRPLVLAVHNMPAKDQPSAAAEGPSA